MKKDNIAGAVDQNELVTRRLDFMDIDARSCASIKSLKPFIEAELPKALDAFYAKVRKVPELKNFFSSDAHMAQAKNAQIGHWNNISNGDFGPEYGRKVRTIGSVHARIGLEPTWYIGGYAMIADHLVRAAVKDMFPKSGLFAKNKMNADEVGAALGNLLKAVFLDMDLAISVYMDEAQAARKRAREEASAAEQKIIKDVFGKALAAIAAKDICHRVEGDLPEAYQSLKDDFNFALHELCVTIMDVKMAAGQIQSGTAQISQATTELAKRTEQQAASVEETATALNEITEAVNSSSQRAQEAGKLVEHASKGAEGSGRVVKQAVEAMEAIAGSSGQISNIIGVIDDIAFQTNLLALNAGVEAARAGDAGKGFAVVAQEVRELAQRSANAAKEIKTLITTSGEQVTHGVRLVGETGEALERIATEVREINAHIVSIVEASREQSVSLKEISSAMHTMDQGTQQNASMVEETSASTQQLSSEVDGIVNKLDAFSFQNAPEEYRARFHAPAPKQAAPAPAPKQSVRQMTTKIARSFGGAAAAAAADDWQEF